MPGERTTEQAIDRTATAYANLRATCAQLTPREQAEQAFQTGGPSVDEIEDRLRERRGMPALLRPPKSGAI